MLLDIQIYDDEDLSKLLSHVDATFLSNEYRLSAIVPLGSVTDRIRLTLDYRQGRNT